jgi:hypothetical protein
MEDIQNISDGTLFRVISEGGDVKWNFFALKVMISRLKLKLSMTNNNGKVLQDCYDDLRDLFHRSQNIPNAMKDLQIIVEQFGEEK